MGMGGRPCRYGRVGNRLVICDYLCVDDSGSSLFCKEALPNASRLLAEKCGGTYNGYNDSVFCNRRCCGVAFGTVFRKNCSDDIVRKFYTGNSWMDYCT